MKKLKFALQVIALILAFPVWFVAEMKHTDRALQNSQQNTSDTINVRKVGVNQELTDSFDQGIATMPFPKHMVQVIN